ncbi:MAG: hypothetical protein ACRC68_18010 [Clostridium sp.]
MKYIEQNRKHLIDLLIKSGADKESIEILKAINTITIQKTNTKIILT